jgi:hypothetical protein
VICFKIALAVGFGLGLGLLLFGPLFPLGLLSFLNMLDPNRRCADFRAGLTPKNEVLENALDRNVYQGMTATLSQRAGLRVLNIVRATHRKDAQKKDTAIAGHDLTDGGVFAGRERNIGRRDTARSPHAPRRKQQGEPDKNRKDYSFHCVAPSHGNRCSTAHRVACPRRLV